MVNPYHRGLIHQTQPGLDESSPYPASINAFVLEARERLVHTMVTESIKLPLEEIFEFCRRNHIRKLSLFGSVLRGDARPDSDIDLLVDFEPGHVPGLITLAGMEIELSQILGRKADLRTPRDLSRYFRQEVVDSARTVYAQG